MANGETVKALVNLAFRQDPLEEIIREAEARGPVAVWVMPDGSIQRIPDPNVCECGLSGMCMDENCKSPLRGDVNSMEE